VPTSLSISNANKALSGNTSVGSIVGVVSALFVVIVSVVIVIRVIVFRRKTSDVDQTESDESTTTIGQASHAHLDTMTATQVENIIRGSSELKHSFPTVSFSIDDPLIGFY
jgi:beta-lactamase regulating signal transducer with metallopeptidase domain